MKQLRLIIATALLLITTGIQAQKYVGGDISVLQSYEDNNVAYYDANGKKIDDVLAYLKSEAVGWNALRVRLFVNPTRTAPNKDTKTVDGTTDAQVCQDLDYVVRLGKRIKQAGFAFMLDFHYSDTWADPSNQWTPKDWLALSNEQLQQQIYNYTKECLTKLVEAGATPDFIQTGNEISYGMLWGAYTTGSIPNFCNSSAPAANWTRFSQLLTKANAACREVCPSAQIVLHLERTGNANTLKFILNKLADVDYDVIGLSYYPFWHEPYNKNTWNPQTWTKFSVLSNTLEMLKTNYPSKKVQIVETAYYYQWQPTMSYDFSQVWPVSTQGQAAYAADLVEELNKHSNVNGLYWWFPEENGNGPNKKVLTDWVNRGLWNNSTHRAHAGLYVLKGFLDDETAINNVYDNRPDNAKWYTLSGRSLPTQPTLRGIYVSKGKKVAVK